MKMKTTRENWKEMRDVCVDEWILRTVVGVGSMTL